MSLIGNSIFIENAPIITATSVQIYYTSHTKRRIRETKEKWTHDQGEKAEKLHQKEVNGTIMYRNRKIKEGGHRGSQT